MNFKKYQKLILITALVVIITFAGSSRSGATYQSDGLTEEQRRGQQIYLRGVSASGKDIVATMGNSTAEIPASVMPCANCHGLDGRGKPEGGIIPSNLTWEALTKPYGVVHASGRKHPPYDERLLKRAITLGIDPAGNKLDAFMPRYRLSLQDADDLTAYIKILGKHLDPGLSDTTIKISTTVLTAGPFAEMSRSVQLALRAYFEEINKQGGVFNRRIELIPIESAALPEERIAALRTSFNNDQSFAMVSVFMAGAEKEFSSMIKEKSIPMVGAFTLSPPVGLPPNPFGFYIYPGLKDHGRALAVFAADKYSPQRPRAAIIYTDDEPTIEAAQAIKSRLGKTAWSDIEEIKAQAGQFDIEQTVRALRGKAVEAVFLLVPAGMQQSILQQAQRDDWRATCFIPGLLAGIQTMEAAGSAPGQVFLSVSSLPSDQTREALFEYQKLVEAYKLPHSHAASQIQALAAASTIVEGLKRVGRDISRQKLIEALESLYQFNTGLTPPISYGPNRRVGSAGAYIVTIDKEQKLVPASKLIEPD